MIPRLNIRHSMILSWFAIGGLIVSVFFHINAFYFSGIYYDLYGYLLFGIGFISIAIPALFETHQTIKRGSDGRGLRGKIFATKPIAYLWKIVMIYFVVLFTCSLYRWATGPTNTSLDRLLWSWGTVMFFFASIAYHRKAISDGRS